MSTLTKVFIVILAVIAIVFSILVIQYTALTQNYKALADDNLVYAEEQRQLLASQATMHSVALADLQTLVAEQKRQIDELTVKLGKVAVELDKARSDLLAQQQNGASLTGRITQLVGILKGTDAERKQIQKQLTAGRKQVAALQTENFKFAKSNQELELQRQLYEQEIRLLKEQNVSLEQMAETLRGRIASAASGDDQIKAGKRVGLVSDPLGSSIMGQITQVREKLASVSVGTAQGVKQGMEFIIYRGATYLGKLRIVEVSDDQAVGELKQLQGAIRVGDVVADKLNS